MTEVRAKAARTKGQLNFEQDCTYKICRAPGARASLLTHLIVRTALYAYGDDPEPLPETLRILDEIVTDFVIETCHTAARSATYSNRQKIKVDDFKFAVRRSDAMLGRLQERATLYSQINKARQDLAAEMKEGKLNLERGGKHTKDDGADGTERPKKKQRKSKKDTTVMMET